MSHPLVVNVRSGRHYDVYVGRPMLNLGLFDAGWGNPFRVSRKLPRSEAIAEFREFLLHSPEPRAVWMRDNLDSLRGKVLACWCPPLLCHAEVLAELANVAEAVPS